MAPMTMLRPVQRGFTLIELMMVVAIIGILAAIAMPAYQDFTVRSKIVEAALAGTAGKTAVSEAFQSGGTTAVQAVAVAWDPAATGSKYVRQVTLDNTGVVTVVIAANAANGIPTGLDGNTLVYTPSVSGAALAPNSTGSIDWACGSNTTGTATARGLVVNAGTLPAKYAPSECR